MAPRDSACPQCGAAIGPGVFFCPRCGTGIPVPEGARTTLAAPPGPPPDGGRNAQLDALVDQVQQVVQGVQPQELRDNDGLRRHVAEQLTRVGATLEGMLVDKPRRRIIRSSPSGNGVNHATAH